MRLHTTIVLSCMALSQCFAQPADKPFVLDHYTVAQGLSSNSITCIIEDKRGFIWASTNSGLNRFDGLHFKQYFYDPNNEASPSDDGGNELYEDRNGYIWYSTMATGLNRYDPKTDSFKRYFSKNSADNSNVTGYTFAEDRSGVLYMMSEQGLCAYDAKTDKIRLIHFNNEEPVLPAITRKIFFKHDNRMFLGTVKGVFEVDLKNKKIDLLPGTDAFGANCLSITEDSRGHLWIGTWGGGLMDYDLQTNTPHRYGQRIDGNGFWIFTDITIRNQGGNEVLWGTCLGPDIFTININNGDINQYDVTGYFPEFTQPVSITNVFCDHNNALWFSTNYGVMKIDPLRQLFKTVGIDASIQPEWFTDVTAIYQDIADKSGNTILYGVSQGGLFEYHMSEKTTEKIVLPEYLINEFYPTKILRRNGAEIWIGSNKGLIRYDQLHRSAIIYNSISGDNHSLSSNFISDIEIDQQNRLWIGTHSTGYNLYIDSCDCFRQFRIKQDSGKDPVRRSENINDIFIAPDNSIWMARGYNGAGNITGLSKVDPVNFNETYFDSNNKALTNFPALRDVFCVTVDDNGAVWTGNESGLMYFNPDDKETPGKYHRITLIDHLYSNHIYGVEIYGDFIWLTGNNGVSIFDRKKDQIVRIYTNQDGLIDNQVSAMEQGFTGKIFFGNHLGFQYIDAAEIQPNKNIPPVYITSVKVLDKQYLENNTTALFTQKITIHHSQNKITFEFAALNLTNSSQNKYAYQLSGVDKDWVYTNSNQVNYNNLKAGKYQFRVKASNDNGIWNYECDYMDLIIIPPWYQTIWFYLACLVLFLALLYSAYRIRVAQLLRIERLRQKISRDLHDDVGSSLSSINMLSALAKKRAADDSAKTEQILKKINETASNTMENMSDIVWAIHPKNDSLAEIRTRMLEYLSDTLESKQIEYTLHIDPSILHTKLPLDIRRDFYLFFKEGINNLAKHAEATRADISVIIEHRSIQLTIKDNGKGFDTEIQRFGNGVINFKTRAKNMHAQYTLHSVINKGTEIKLIVPLP